MKFLKVCGIIFCSSAIIIGIPTVLQTPSIPGLVALIIFVWAAYALIKSVVKVQPKGINNPYDYYPEEYGQDSTKSIVADDGRYDLTRISAHEDSVIRKAIYYANKNYPPKYRGIGLANESYVITYKPRYILFELVIMAFENSNKPLDHMAVSFAYIQKGSVYREDAIRYFETAINKVSIYELNKFASVSALSFLPKVAEAYKMEHEYDKAIWCLKKVIKYGGGNNKYFKEKIKVLKSLESNEKPIRRRKMSNKQAIFEQQTHEAAARYIDLLDC